MYTSISESTPSMTRKPRIAVREFSVFDGAMDLDFRNDCEFEHAFQRSAAILVQLDVDGERNIVSADTGQFDVLRVLERTIESLSEVKARYEQMIPVDSRLPRRCMGQGDWGTCYSEDGHGGAHKFPTEAEWESIQLPPLPPRLKGVTSNAATA